MSKFTGKCDLYDHMMMEKMHPSTDNPNIWVSDELECFKIFKERTKGKLYQHRKVNVTEINQDFIEKNCKFFNIIRHETKISDARYKNGYRIKTYYTYKYHEKEYNTLKELNKKGVYITIEIKFDSIFDLVPYYPYIIGSSTSDSAGETIYISNSSYIDEKIDRYLESGISLEYIEFYKKELQNHYLQLAKRINYA